MSQTGKPKFDKLAEWVKVHSPEKNSRAFELVYTIGQAAEMCGLSDSALRKYEAAGLIIFQRSPGGFRLASDEDIFRIKLIQRLIKEYRLNLEGIRRLMSMIPCWEFKNCSEEARQACPVFEGANEPCWSYFKAKGGCADYNCRLCEVYRMAASCTTDLKKMMLDLVVGSEANKEPSSTS